tara:strand:- start:178767 stop:180209 length:1443 start_codon:yes stop_codon:yes gene_type:complete
MNEYRLFIDGKWVASSSGKKSISYNPYSGDSFAVIHSGSESDINTAIESSHRAFKNWSKSLPQVREDVFINAARIIEESNEELLRILIEESGSTHVKAGFELYMTSSCLKGMAGECRRIGGQTFISESEGVRSYSIRQPLGVVAAISPFNFPLLLAVRKIGWAIAAGNCVVLKPSEVTPVIALKLAEILKHAGLPDGVLNVVPAEAEDIGDSLVGHPKVKKITFTGSTSVGRRIAKKSAGLLKKFTLELGGKNPLIVLKDADVDYAVDVAAFSNFIHQGQVCMTGSRIIVEKELYDEFCAKLTEKVKLLKVGDPRDPEVIIGPLIRPSQIEFIKQLVEQSVASGAKLLIGGESSGNCFHPTVLSDVTPLMPVFCDECFGPVAAVIKAENHEHALELANDSEYGLTAAVITNDLQKSYEIAEALQTGMVHINGPTIRDEAVVPFGGVKDSGFGREGGQFAIEGFTELKWITVQLGQQKFPF